jgi:hypothetical protein
LATLATSLEAFAALTPDPSEILLEHGPTLLAPLGTQALEAADLDAAYQAARDQTAAVVSQVEPVIGSEVNLISDDGRVPVTVHNASKVAIKGLTVELRPKTIALRVEGTATVDIPAGKTATARIPVHALANGQFDVDVVLSNALGQQVGTSARLNMRIRAEWEFVGTIVMAGLFAAALTIGIVRTVRKHRRDHAPEQIGAEAT